MSLLVGGSVSFATAFIRSLASRFSIATCFNSCQLLVVACLHLQPIWKRLGLASTPDVVSRGKPDVDNLVHLVVAVLVDHLVDGGVPVQGFVLLNVAGVARSIPQISIGNLRSHCKVRSCPIKPKRVSEIYLGLYISDTGTIEICQV